jgi:hypothetical protein
MNLVKVILWALVFGQIFSSCAPVPYFHRVIIKPHISGTLVNQDSITPVRGVQVKFRNQTKIADSTGRFEFEPIFDYRYWCLFVIGPFGQLMAKKPIELEMDSLTTSSMGRVESRVFIESDPPSRSCLELNREFKRNIRNDIGKIILYKIAD